MKTKGSKMKIDKIASLQLQPDYLEFGNIVATIKQIIADNEGDIDIQIDMELRGLFERKPALKWTSDLPTQEGWYWVKVCHGQRPIIVHHVDGRVTAPNEEHAMSIKKFEAFRWYGPIEQPEYREKEQQNGAN